MRTFYISLSNICKFIVARSIRLADAVTIPICCQTGPGTHLSRPVSGQLQSVVSGVDRQKHVAACRSEKRADRQQIRTGVQRDGDRAQQKELAKAPAGSIHKLRDESKKENCGPKLRWLRLATMGCVAPAGIRA